MTSSRKYVRRHHECLKCGSSDAASTYDDGLTHCFSCNATYKSDGKEDDLQDNIQTKQTTSIAGVESFDTRGFEERQIRKEISEYFGVKVSYNDQRQIDAHYYPYTSKGKTVAYKVRSIPKAFKTIGEFSNVELFGQREATSGKTLVVTEGELDAMAVAQAYSTKYNGKIYPVVSLPSAAGIATLVQQRDWVRKFETVVLMLDNDKAGLEATEKAARAIGIDRVKIATLKEKDASDELLSHGAEAVMQAIWNAQPYSPAGIVQGEQLWEAYQERLTTVSIPYPKCMLGVNDKTKGMRMGEISLFTSGTGSGKSTLIKEIILHLIKTQDDKIGLVSLEESIGDTVEKLITMECQTKEPTSDDARKAFETISANEQFMMLDHQGSVSDQSLTDKIEELCLLGCKYLILDHLTIAVSEGAEGLEGNAATDKVMSDLLKICKQYNVWLGVISHLRKAAGGNTTFEEGKLASMDDIKGSGSIKQISFDIIAFARNLVAEDDSQRNTMKMRVLKSRYTGFTGDAGAAIYNADTCRLTYVDPDFMDFGTEL